MIDEPKDQYCPYCNKIMEKQIPRANVRVYECTNYFKCNYVNYTIKFHLIAGKWIKQ